MTTEYEKHAHTVQTAIAYNPDAKALEPKHLRVGIDMSKADQAGLARLLIDKGVFTEAEYVEAITQSAKEEAERQRLALAATIGVDPDDLDLR